jgi:hypothetical protein
VPKYLVAHPFTLNGVQIKKLTALTDDQATDVLQNHPGYRKFLLAVKDGVDLGNIVPPPTTPSDAPATEESK